MNRIVLVLLLLLVRDSFSQSFFTTPARYLTPGWRGSAGTEFSRWDIFYSPYNGINYPDMDAPNGIGQLASEAGFTPPSNSSPGDPYAFWHLQNPTLSQNGTDTAFIIAPGASGNIYSFADATAYQIADATPYTLGSVVVQFQDDGQLMDLSSIKLAANGNEYAPTNFITEYKASGSSFGGFTNRSAAQWNLTGLNLTSYTITFKATDTSNSLQELLLDSTPTYAEAVPSARSWNVGGGNWNVGGNWSPASLPPTGGNINIANAGSLTIDGGTRTIGELKISAPGSFTIGASGGILKMNTGITATPASAATYTIGAPISMGSYNLINLNANTTLLVNQPISGATGMYVFGEGVMRLNANNSFTAGLSLDGPRLEIAGTNSYTGSTTVFAGALVAKGNAPSGSAGALGNATTPVTLGSGGDFSTPEAALLIEGAFTIARNVTLTAGADAKKLGGLNTGVGAVFSGNVIFNSTASGVQLEAQNATDKVTFTGAITGGTGAGTLTKTGLGRVILGGGTPKSYANPTTVSAGTLEIAAGTTVSGNVTVAAGATLSGEGTINGSLNVNADGLVLLSSGTFTVNGGVVNDGNIVITRGAVLFVANSSVFTNNGTLDLTTGSFTSPGGFVNNGIIIDSSVVRVKSIGRDTSVSPLVLRVALDSYTGHTYQLQRATSLATAASFANLGAPVTGQTGQIITFEDTNPPATSGFYRVMVDP